MLSSHLFVVEDAYFGCMKMPVFFLLFLFLSKSFFTNAQHSIPHYIPVVGSKVYAKETGSGEALILLHAGNLDHRMWKNQVDEFSKRFRVVTIDLRGCGLTEDGDSTYPQSTAISVVMDSLHIQKASLAGVSLGAVSSAEFALDYPGKVDKLILASPGIIGFEPEHDTMVLHCYRRMDTAWKQHDTLQYINLFINAWADGPYRKPGDMNQQVRNEIFMMASQNIRKRKDGVHLGFTSQPSQFERLSSLKMPILVITGSLDVSDIKSAAIEYQKQGAKAVVIQGAAHMVNMEKPDEFNKAVLSFLSGK